MTSNFKQRAQHDVIIIGAGIVGTTLACALGQSGLRVVVVEAKQTLPFSTEQPYQTRVSSLSPASEYILKNLSIWPDVEALRLIPFREMQVWDEDGEIHFDCRQVGQHRLGYVIENAVLQTALLHGLEKLQSVELVCPDVLENVFIAEEHADVHLQKTGRLSCSLLVGADGAASEVRRLCGFEFTHRDYQQTAVVANVVTEFPHHFTAWQRFLRSGPVAFLPLANDLCSVVWSTSASHAASLLEATDQEFCEALQSAIDQKFGEISLQSARAAFTLQGGQARPYVKPRVALVGDAAHIIHPLAGQGVNLGLLDAAVLAETLIEEGDQDFGGLRLLRRYERGRKTNDVTMMYIMEAFKALFTSNSDAVRCLRNFGLNVTDTVKPVKHHIMKYAMGLSGDLPELAHSIRASDYS